MRMAGRKTVSSVTWQRIWHDNLLPGATKSPVHAFVYNVSGKSCCSWLLTGGAAAVTCGVLPPAKIWWRCTGDSLQLASWHLP
jgi:hypothetical protein